MKNKNILQNLVEKPRQAIINLTTMVKTRIAECQEKERQQRETYLTTPPKPEESTTREWSSVNYGVSTCTWVTEKWNDEISRWEETEKYTQSLR